MRQSRLGLSALLLIACGGFDPTKLTPPASDAAEAGVAGFSYDAGVGAQAGRATSTPSGKAGGGSWQLEGGASGDPAGASEAGATGGLDDSKTRGSPSANGGQASGSGGAVAGARAWATGGAVGSAGHSGGSGAPGGGGSGSGGSHVGAAGAASGAASGTGGAGAAGHGAGGQGATAGTSAHAAAGASGGGEGGAGGSAGASGPGSRELFFSEYVEGSSKYKALEIRALGATNLNGCDIATYFNDNVTASTLYLDASVAAGEVYVLCSTDLASVAGVHCDRATNLTFNGNDSIVLECEGVTLDVIGQIGSNPKTAWSDDAASTQDQTLRRRCDVTVGDALGYDAFTPSLEWQAFPIDTFDGLGSPACE